MMRGAIALFLLLGAGACAGRLPVDELEARAARDLACPESQVRGRIAGTGRFYGTARGCGREEKYELWCALDANGKARQCEWIRASTASAARGAVSP